MSENFSGHAANSSLSSWILIFPANLEKKKSHWPDMPSLRTVLRVWEFGILINDLNINLIFSCSPASMAPSRKHDIASGAVRALIAGTVACFMTACIAGTACRPLCPISPNPQNGSFWGGGMPPTQMCSICHRRKLRGRAAVEHIAKWNVQSMVEKLRTEGRLGNIN